VRRREVGVCQSVSDTGKKHFIAHVT